ncbi:hypothetical protein [Streptomyces malaysiensis]|uniref:Uncharacterized protein n=1 Tax=Streptomyces malaysiensis subsp. samsunensis TaxID=459658 RepID=A0A9X2RX77_STRMQ|nr:hypothetical protein [Streptomyces samsunensis]MCQ8831584.1 hypothetical protein [Streptomyces samsunensis]
MSDVLPTASRFGRRDFLTAGLGIAGGVTLWAGGLTGPATAAGAERALWREERSANGWPVTSEVHEHQVEGTEQVTVPLLAGDVATALLFVARRFNYEIATLDAGEVTGHSMDRAVSARYESNYLSGTAIAIRPVLYPVGSKDGLFPHETVVIRDILADCEGVVRWGGDEKIPKESHFQIDVGPGDERLATVARKFEQWDRTPGAGPGTINAFVSERQRAAKALERRQRVA